MNTPKKASIREALKLVKDRIKTEKAESQEQKEFDVRKAAELMLEKQKESAS